MLSDKAMLVCLNISLWEARKSDKEISRETEKIHGAEKDTCNTTKQLIAKTAVASYKKIAGQARNFLNENTLPWDDQSNRILSVKARKDLDEKLYQLRDEFFKNINIFISNLSDLKQESEQKLNSIYRESDYPSEDELKKKFKFNIVYSPLIETKDIRINIEQDELQKIIDQTENRYKLQYKEAIKKLWDDLHFTIKTLYNTMVDKDKQFKKSTLENVEFLVGFLDKYNFDGDKRLDEIKDLISKNLTGYDAENLRQNITERKQLADKANEVLNKIESYL